MIEIAPDATGGNLAIQPINMSSNRLILLRIAITM